MQNGLFLFPKGADDKTYTIKNKKENGGKNEETEI